MTLFNTKNVCLFTGIVFGILMYFYDLFFIPSVFLLIIGGIQSFEISIKKKKCIEEHLNFKLKNYEEENLLLKKDFEKLKVDFESFKAKLGVSQMYGHKQ